MSMRKNKGFTLMELLIAVSIFAVIALCLYSAFSGGVRVWRIQEENFKYAHNVKLTLDRMARELRNSIAYSQKAAPSGGVTTDANLVFRGEANELSFITILGEDIARVSYTFDQAADGKGLLGRKVFLQKDGFKEEGAKQEKMLGGVKDISFEYAYAASKEGGEAEWKSLWDKEGPIPKGVRVTVEFDSEDKKQGREIFKKTVFIPAGVWLSE